MDFTDVISRRYSTRQYLNTPVEEEKLQAILAAAQIAPTAANRQPFVLIVAKTSGRESELQRIYHRDWLLTAPLIICACGLSSRAWVRNDGRSYLDVDIAIMMDHITLAATNQGLGTCWIAAFNQTAAREVFGIPKEVEPLVIMPLGYPADAPLPKERKPLSQLVRYEKW